MFAVLAALALWPPLAAAQSVEEALRERVAELRRGEPLRLAGGDIAARTLVPQFYEAREFRPAWSAAKLADMLALAETSREHGLDPADYQLEALRKAAASGDEPARVAERELLFTDALIRLAYHLHFGKANPRELYAEWNFSRSLGDIRPVDALGAALAAPRLVDVVEAYAPQLGVYRRLREGLADYRRIEAAGGWPLVPAGPTLHPAARDARVAALRARMQAGGDLRRGPVAEPQYFDAALAAALKGFQARHGLEADGTLGRRTLAELNVGVAQRIERIRVNLERLRWVAQDLAGDYLLVNTAAFDARLYLDNRLAWTSRVVIGKPYRQTPSFRASMQYLVLNPRWVVPPTIAREDLQPKIDADPDYLERHHMRLAEDKGRRQIVQAPGADNPLGRVKFMLPNPYSIYLHDTPSKGLFERADRAFSSGCIRLERPLELAVSLLDDPQWNLQTLGAAIAGGETRSLPVRRKVPVLLLYFTAFADEDGRMNFRPDLYGRDPEVLAALQKPFRFSSVGHDAAPQAHE